MAYQSNKPQATNRMSQSQQDLLNNFGEVNNFVNTDHGAFNGPLQGMHAKITLPRLSNPPANPFTSDATGFFCAYGLTEGTIRQTYAHNTIAGGVKVDVPFTESVLATNVAPGESAGWTYLPSGILMKWGTSTTINGTLVINLNSGGQLGPNFTQTFNAQLSPRSSYTVQPYISGMTSSLVSITSTEPGKQFYWIIIGRGV
jgi:hypothetical protein